MGGFFVLIITNIAPSHYDPRPLPVPAGPVRYMKSLQVGGNLRAPVVNGLRWDHLLHRQAPSGPILSNFSFTSAFVSHDVISDDINGLDLSEDVVLVNSEQTIHGEVYFFFLGLSLLP